MNGFSAIELVFAIALMSILFFICTANLTSSVDHQLSLNVTNKIFHNLQWARTEAIKRNQMIGICGTLDQQHCSSDWSSGYMVFVIDKKNKMDSSIGFLRLEKMEPLIKTHSGNQSIIKYSGDGRCLSRGTVFIGKENKIVLYDSGRARIENLDAQYH